MPANTVRVSLPRSRVSLSSLSASGTADLEGRSTVMVANLKARKMRFGVSEGMALAAGSGGKDLFLLSPDEGAAPGSRVT